MTSELVEPQPGAPTGAAPDLRAVVPNHFDPYGGPSGLGIAEGAASPLRVDFVDGRERADAKQGQPFQDHVGRPAVSMRLLELRPVKAAEERGVLGHATPLE